MKFRLFSANASQQPNDEDLLARYRNTGDLSVLGTLYARYTELCYGVCLKYLDDEDKAADAVMDIFEELVEKTLKHDIGQFRPWLYVLAKNHCLMRLRKASKEFSQSFDPELMHSLPLAHPDDDNAGLDREASIQQLENCLQGLNAVQQDCLRLFYFDDKSYLDIAELRNLDLGAVRSHIQNGRRNLKQCMTYSVKSSEVQ
jgi:RNA polymerase sigma factor (sigma-70 family)